MPGARGGKRDYKPRRGGGKSFSRNLQPLDDEGNETNTPDRYEPRARRTEEDSGGESGSTSGSEDGSESDSSEDGLGSVGAVKPKKEKKDASGAAIVNPNRTAPKHIKASDISSTTYEPSRKDREAAEKKAAEERYWKLHEAGKTDQAKSDLARLKIIKEKREAAAKAREAEKEAAVEEARVALEKSKGIGKKA